MQTTPLSKQHGTASWLPSCASGIDGTQRTAGLYSDLGVFFSVGGELGVFGVWSLGRLLTFGMIGVGVTFSTGQRWEIYG